MLEVFSLLWSLLYFSIKSATGITVQYWPGCVKFMVGLNDLSFPFQPKHFYACMIKIIEIYILIAIVVVEGRTT